MERACGNSLTVGLKLESEEGVLITVHSIRDISELTGTTFIPLRAAPSSDPSNTATVRAQLLTHKSWGDTKTK